MVGPADGFPELPVLDSTDPAAPSRGNPGVVLGATLGAHTRAGRNKVTFTIDGYLHSAGQLHKGGPDTGTYLVLTAESPADPAIPKAPCGFATLLCAQALDDFRALAQHGRRVLRVHIGGDFDAGLAGLLNALS